MIIEYLKFLVIPELREQFVQKDAEIWTAALTAYTGFLGKQVWISPADLGDVVLVIQWASVEDWQSIPSDTLQETEAQFFMAMGDTYELIESNHYQVRKFLYFE